MPGYTRYQWNGYSNMGMDCGMLYIPLNSDDYIRHYNTVPVTKNKEQVYNNVHKWYMLNESGINWKGSVVKIEEV